MKISSNDIKSRVYKLSESYNYHSYNNYIHEDAFNNIKLNDIRESMRSYTASILNESDIDIITKNFDKMLDLYEKVNESYTSPSVEIDTCVHYLVEAVERTRTPKEMQTLLKRRISLGTREKSVTKLKNKMSNIANTKTHGDMDANLKNNANNLIKKIEPPKINVPKPSTNSSSSSTETTQENCYNTLIDICQKNIEIDRIISNFNELSKRFNIVRVMDNIKQSIPEDIDIYCELFNTWTDDQMSKKSKFNVSIETALYINDKYNMNIDRSSLIESIVDYYLFNNNSYDFVYSCLQSNRCITSDDMIPYNEYYDRLYNNLSNDIESIIENESKNPDKNMDTSISDFKKSDKKDPAKFKEVLSKAYTKTPEQIINETPKVFDIFRFFIMVSSIAISPVLGLVTFFTDQFLKRDNSREKTAKMIDKYNKEIKTVSKKIKACNDEEKKKNLKEYKNKIQEDLYKIMDYERELYTDKEYEELEDKRNQENMDDDFDFDEAASLLSMIESTMKIDTGAVEKCIEKNIDKITESFLIDDITNFVIETKGFFSVDNLKKIYENYYLTIKNSNNKNYISMNILRDNINRLTESIDNDNNYDNDIQVIMGINEFVDAINLLNNELSSPFFIETSFNNTFNIIKNKIHDIATTLSDKDKEISNRIDSGLSDFKTHVEKFFTTEQRENVLKGSILPKASTMLKLIIGNGLIAIFVSPALAIIGILGYLGVSKIASHKERQAILDEIDIELEMVDKYIQQAEQKDNLKAVRNLLKTKNRLQKEKVRIKYKMKMHGEKMDPKDLK